MVKRRQLLLAKALMFHRGAAYLGGLALILFSLSGLCHVVMTWTGPQAVAFFPPQMTIDPTLVSHIPATLQRAGIATAGVVKVVQTEKGSLLQVTENHSNPRRYFDLTSGGEVPDYDQQHAVWLARYYSGTRKAPVRSITFQTEFSDDYPWVNRLLPVYRIEFDTPEDLTVFIYTELGALGDITDSKKVFLQALFRWGHTWSFLDDVEVGRVLALFVFLVSIIGMALSGLSMISLMKRRKMPWYRAVHRLTGFFIWLPILALSSSGLVHLFASSSVYSTGARQKALQLPSSMVLSTDRFVADVSQLNWLAGKKATAVSLMEGSGGERLFRISIATGDAPLGVDRSARFKGVPSESSAIFVSASTGQKSNVTDREVAIHHATKHLGAAARGVFDARLMTQFGPVYDFRNKRLPAWAIDYKTEKKGTMFIDPASGMQIDHVTSDERVERYSFSVFHKWNILTPFIGRAGRDVVIALVIAATVCATGIGFWLRFASIKMTAKRRENVACVENGPS